MNRNSEILSNPRLAAVTVLPLRSTAGLDLTTLPDRLTDEQLATVEAMAAEPLPTLPPCDDRHFAKCLRIMLAVLPKQNTDELGGELFVEAYRRQLGHHSNEAISFLADRATASCRWFPTIAECLEILSGWRRSDEASRRRSHARQLAHREREQRRWEDLPTLPDRRMTQADVDTLPIHLRDLGLTMGYLIRDPAGNVVIAPSNAA